MPSRAGCWLVGVVAALGALLIVILMMGTVVVVDRTGEVESAVVTNGEAEQRLRRLPGGIFFGIPDLEGAVEVRCRNGARREGGYVTSHLNTWVKVVGPVPCEQVVEL